MSNTNALKALVLSVAALALPGAGHAETSLQSRVDHCTGAALQAVQAHSIAMLAAADGLVVQLAQDPLASAPSSDAWCAVAVLAWRDGLDISGRQLDTLITAADVEAATPLTVYPDEYSAMLGAAAGLR